MGLAGQKMRSSFTRMGGTIDPDLWLHTKDQQVGATVRVHAAAGFIEYLTWDLDAPRSRRVTSILLNRATGKAYSAQDAHQSVATRKAKSLAGMP